IKGQSAERQTVLNFEMCLESVVKMTGSASQLVGIVPNVFRPQYQDHVFRLDSDVQPGSNLLVIICECSMTTQLVDLICQHPGTDVTGIYLPIAEYFREDNLIGSQNRNIIIKQN